MTVIVTLAAYNEAQVIGPVVGEIVGLGYGCIVVDDGSTDNTAATAKAHGAAVVRHHINLGQGHAILTGIAAAMLDPECEIIVGMDADGQHAPSEIAVFVDRLRSTKADLVVGSRVLGASAQNNHFLRRAFAPFYTAVINRMTGLHLSDALTGFRAWRRSSLDGILDVLESMLEPQYLTSEMLFRLTRAGFIVDEVPVHIRDRLHGASHKGLLRMGVGIIRAILKAAVSEARSRPQC